MSRGSADFRRAGDVSPLIVIPAIESFNLCMGACLPLAPRKNATFAERKAKMFVLVQTTDASGRILILSGSQRDVLPAIQARRADTSNAGVREPPIKKR